MLDPLLGRTIADRYRLITRLGEGAHTVVYLARHVLINRLSAVKIVSRAQSSAGFRERFLREARAVNHINHPNIVEISDFGEADGLVYLVMEYVPGETLGALLERGPLGMRTVAAIGVQATAALARAHEMGIVHGALAPNNLLVVPQRESDVLVKLSDFGAEPTSARSGRIAYAAPEQRELGIRDGRVDLYAIGAILYEALTGSAPDWAAASAPRVEGAPSLLGEAIHALVARDPSARPRDAFEARHLLERALEDAPPATLQWGGPRSVVPSDPQPSLRPPSSPLLPSIARIPFEQIGPVCDRALAKLVALIAAMPVRPDTETSALLEDARRQCAMVSAAAALVASDAQAREAAEGRAREARAALGDELDAIARERSRALGWASTLGERAYRLEARRSSGDLPLPEADAMVWEQAALEQEEARMHAEADQLLERMRACQGEIDASNARLEHELLVINACIEGRIAALRSLAAGAWIALSEAAIRAGVQHEFAAP